MDAQLITYSSFCAESVGCRWVPGLSSAPFGALVFVGAYGENVLEAFDVIDLATWTRGENEPGGDEEKRWFRAPEGADRDGHWLFKPRRIKTLELSKERRRRGDAPDRLIRGEDWAEKISYELARLIDLPAARTELATVVRLETSERVLGSMSQDMRPVRWSWTPGAALLAELDDNFDAASCEGHTLAAIHRALDGLDGPVGTPYEAWPAFDVFAGYMVLDALIANTDRHAHNWGVLQNPTTGAICLGPSFDHGSALASGNGDPDRERLVTTNQVRRWCERGRTKRFDGGTPTGLIDVAQHALAQASVHARHHWIDKLTDIDARLCDDVVKATPNLSDPTRTFLIEALATNRKRLCDALH